MEIYLDNAATTKPLASVIRNLENTLFTHYGNPSSLHRKGLEAEKFIKEVRRSIAREINGKYSQIIFTSGGTESNNVALLGFFRKNKKEANIFRCLVSGTEHKSTLNSMEYLKSKGAEVHGIEVDQKGLIPLDHLEEMLSKGIDLLSVSHVNNETGAIQPINAIGSLFKRYSPDGFFHVDGVQSFCKLPVDVLEGKIDAYSASAHKIHGLKGSGFLFLKEMNRVSPILFGGAQERELRPGTENVPGIVSLGTAVQELAESRVFHYNEVAEKKSYFIGRINDTVRDVLVNGSIGVSGSPYILNVSFPGVKSEVLLHTLESEGIYVSSGSACNAKKTTRSHVLEGMQLKDERIDSAIRFSFSPFTTHVELDHTIEVLNRHIESLRRIMKR